MTHTAPVFVTGMPRSGTTLLASLLNAHSAIAISPETDYFPRVWKPLARHSEPPWDLIDQALSHFFRKPSVALMQLPEATLRTEFRVAWEKESLTHRLMLSRILETYAARRDKPIWGEKTPDHFMYISAIKTTFPEARIIAIVRDPRDVHLSLERVPWSRGNALNHALQWRGYQKLARQYQEHFSASYIQIRYEDLITDPERTLRALCSWLDLPYEPTMMTDYPQELLFDPAHEPWKDNAAHSINPSNRNKWRCQMALSEIALFSRVCGRAMRTLRYEVPEVGALPGPVLKNLEWRSVLWWARTRRRVNRGREPWFGTPIAEEPPKGGRGSS